MPALLIYLFKVNIALILFCLGYYVVLRQLTFYNLNRVYLVTALIFSTIYPTINFTSVVEKHQQLAQPLQVIIIDLDVQAGHITKPIAQTNYWQWVVVLFWSGVAVMALRLMIQLLSLYKLYRRSKPALLGQQKVRIIDDATNPFSFWQSIYINPGQHGANELQDIIAHEQIHVKQWHTLDILLAELSLVFYWFNPGVWLLKKAISENLEFITDRKVLQRGTDAKSYQYSLLYTSFNTSPNAIVNHFNISTIKKRIFMMNAKNSSPFNLTRYGIMVPAIFILLIAFGTSKAAFLKKGVNAAKNITHKAIDMVSSPAFTAHTVTAISQNIAGVATPGNQSVRSLLTAGIDDKHRKDTLKLLTGSRLKLLGADSAYYVINGKPVTIEKASTLNPNQIASIHMFDAPSAASIFGNLAPKGAVIIITKDGQSLESTKVMKDRVEAARTRVPITGTATMGAVTVHGSLNPINIYSSDTSKIGTTKGGGHLTSVTINGNADTLNRNTKGGRSWSFVLSKNSAANPLIIVDQTEVSQADLNKINLLDIQDLTVFKDDAYFTKLYGKKAVNGVIVITTNRSKKNK